MSIAFFFFFLFGGEDENKNNDFNAIRDFFERMPDELKKIYDPSKTNLIALLNELYGKSSIPGMETNFTKAVSDFEKRNNENIQIILSEINSELSDKVNM